MGWLSNIAGWCCIAFVVMMVLPFLVAGIATIGYQIYLHRLRRQFREHATIRYERRRIIVTDTALAVKLSAMGDYELSAGQGVVEFRWSKPAEVTPGFAPLDLQILVSPDNIGPDEITFGLWQRFLSDQQDHWADFSRKLLNHYRWIMEGEPTTTDAEILAQVRGVTISLNQEGLGATGTHDMSASFDIPWEEEHGFYLNFDEASGKFVDDA